MASIPRKSVKGANLKKWLVETIDGILDYLHSSRIRPGYGIAVDETPSGTIVRLASTPSGNAPISTGGGGTGVSGGLGIVVSGGTGGNPYLVNANLQGGTDISITGGSGGNPLVISYTGGGGAGSGLNAPDWRNIASGTTPEGNTVIELTKNGTATTTSTAGFIYAYAEFTYGAAYPAYASAHVVVNGGTFKVCSLAMTDYPNGDTPVRMGAGITIPVISGAEVRFIVSTTDYNGNPDNSAFITNAGCVLYQNLS